MTLVNSSSFPNFCLPFFAIASGMLSFSALAKPTLKTSFDNNPPKFMKNDNGKFMGLCVELLELISQDTGIHFQHSSDFIPKKRYRMQLESGKIDLMLGLSKNKKREQIYQFGEPLYSVKLVGVVPKSHTAALNSLNSINTFLSGQRALSVYGSGSAKSIKKYGVKLDDGGRTVEANLTKMSKGRGKLFI